MSARVWAGPWVQVIDPTPIYVSKAAQYCTGGWVNFFPSNADGTPASTWVLTMGRAVDWTPAEADAEMIDLFGGDLPASANTPDELRAFLRSRTVGDVPLVRRQAIQANLDSLGVVRSDFTLSTPLWKVFQRVCSTLFEKDANFGARFHF